MDVFLSALADAALDTLKALPILYLAYLLVAYFSHSQSKNFTKFLNKSRKAGPAVGAFLGCIPQCGFSSVMADFYSKRSISLGTLIAVFIATSDEAIPIMISEPAFIGDMLVLIGLKVVFAIIFGYIVDLVVSLFNSKKHDILPAQPVSEEEFEHQHDHCACGGHSDKNGSCHKENIFLDALLLAGVIGLIPNCAASVFLVELYINGGIAFSAMLAGLSVGAGVGLFVLFAKNRGKIQLLQNFLIIILMYIFGVASGLVTSFIY